MLVTLDNMAHRYHCLPSEALARATTFDLKVLDTGAKYSKYRHDKDNGIKTPSRPIKDYTVDELGAILKQVK